jgi:hypothetical protein
VGFSWPVLFPPTYWSNDSRALTSPVPVSLGAHRLRYLGYEVVDGLQFVKVVEQVVKPCICNL